MRTPILALLICIVACGQNHKNSKDAQNKFKAGSSQKNDTIIALHAECTECSDLYKLQGNFTIPNDLDQKLTDKNFDFKVVGNFPFELINMNSFNYDPLVTFKITGKLIDIDTNNAIGNIPVFYVDTCNPFNFDLARWKERGELNSYPSRPEMIQDMMDNLMFEGQHLNDIINILGRPDQSDAYEITYKIDKEYGPGIDPDRARKLKIRFRRDSIITGKLLSRN